MTNVLFIPGIKGTELFEGDNKVWFPKSTRDLKSLNYQNKLEPKDLLRSVKAFKYIHADIYKGIVENSNPTFYEFYGYDWRQDLQDEADKLVLQLIKKFNQEKPVILVAHSMGGILAKLAILKLAELGLDNIVKKIITIGTPWHGAPDAYKSLAYGEPGMFLKFHQVFQFLDDKKTRTVARQCPSVYQLLPSEHYFASQHGRFLYSDVKQHHYVDIIQNVSDFYNEENPPQNIWNRYMSPVQKAMLQPLPDGIEHDCLVGVNYPTLYQLPDMKLLKMRIFFKYDAIFMNGDGVVPIFSALPAHKANIYYFEGQHHELCSEEGVIKFIEWSRTGNVGGLPAGISLEAEESLNSGFMAAIKCPVTPTFLDKDENYVAGQYDPSIDDVSDLATDPKVMYFSIGDSKYLFLPEYAKEDLKVKVASYEAGIADISLQYLDKGEVTEVQFEPLPVEKGEAAVVSIPLDKDVKSIKMEKPTTGEEFHYKVSNKKSTKSLYRKMEVPLTKLAIDVDVSEGSQKTKRRSVFFGSIVLKISYDETKVENVYFAINDGAPVQYLEPVKIALDSGEHKIKAFGKDTEGRPLEIQEKVVKVDNERPITKVIANVNPDGLDFSFLPLTSGARTETWFRVNGEEEWRHVAPKDVQRMSWRGVLTKKQEYIQIDYYSENEFGIAELPRTLRLSLGNIPILMWDEKNNSAVTPEMIWNSLFKNNDLVLSDFKVSLISRTTFDATYSQIIGDDVKGVKFYSDLFDIDVMYDEKYQLFFYGSPTEILKVGQEYEFSFQLKTERTGDYVTHTEPSARLHPVKAGRLKDVPVRISLQGNTFFGKFTVDESFQLYDYRLIIVDLKNTNPPLRVIPLTLESKF